MGLTRRNRLPRSPLGSGAPGWLRVPDGSLRVRDELLSLGLLTHLLAFVALPALHLTRHAADHEHGPGGAVVRRALHVPHGLHGSPHRESGPSAPEAPAPAHGQGATAHLAAAFEATAVFVFVPRLAPLSEAPAAPLTSLTETGVGHGCAAPRGPPTVG
jgi:hypothetical protein